MVETAVQPLSGPLQQDRLVLSLHDVTYVEPPQDGEQAGEAWRRELQVLAVGANAAVTRLEQIRRLIPWLALFPLVVSKNVVDDLGD